MSAVIDVQQLHKSYGDTVAVDDVSFAVQRGEIAVAEAFHRGLLRPEP